MGNYARIRVRINVTQPLKKFIRISVSNKEEDIIVLLTYERLPDFFYGCGRIGRSIRDCEKPSLDNAHSGFGSWMRAPNKGGGEKPQNKSLSKCNEKTEGEPSGSSATNNKEIMGIEEVEAGMTRYRPKQECNTSHGSHFTN